MPSRAPYENLEGQLDMWRDCKPQPDSDGLFDATGARKDEIRILVALARGHEVSYNWCGTERPRIGYVVVKSGDRWRNIDKSALLRVCDAGLVDSPGFRRPHDDGDWSEPCSLTAAGQAAAANLMMDDDVIFAAPKASSEEQRQAAKAKRTAAAVFKALTFNAARIRGRQVKFVGARDSLVDGFTGVYRYPLADDVMTIVRPHCEEFTDVDGKTSLRITGAGIAATTRPKRAK